MYTYQLTDKGYRILVGGVAPIIDQPHSPNFGLDFIHPAEVNERLAKLVCAKLNIDTNPIVTIQEEVDLMNNARTDEEIQQMAEVFKAQQEAASSGQ
jgi:hypothetical protein